MGHAARARAGTGAAGLSPPMPTATSPRRSSRWQTSSVPLRCSIGTDAGAFAGTGFDAYVVAAGHQFSGSGWSKADSFFGVLGLGGDPDVHGSTPVRIGRGVIAQW